MVFVKAQGRETIVQDPRGAVNGACPSPAGEHEAQICFCSSVVAKSMTSGVGKVGVLLEGELHEQVQRLVLHQSWWLVLMLDHDQPQRPFTRRAASRG